MTEHRCVAFVDLDDTLFSSLRRQQPDVDALPAATLTDGSVICYANPAQQAVYRMLVSSALMVPVTARSMAALSRVLLPLQGPAICSHGGTILRSDGRIDDVWQELMAPHLARARKPLEDFVSLAQRLTDGHGVHMRTWLVDDGGGPVYAVTKHPDHDQDAIRVVAETAAADWLRCHPDYRMHVNGNNLAILPPGVGKAPAVAYLIKGLRDRGLARVVIGAADSHTDLEFLDLCDMMLLPGNSQLADSLRQSVREREAALA